MPEPIDLLIEGTVVTMDGDRRVFRDGAVAVRGDRIVGVDDAAELRERYEPARRLGGRRRMVLPGLIDCHNHLAQALVREYALEDYPNIYRVYIPCEMAMDETDAEVSAKFGVSQLLRAGVTTVAETTCTREHEEPIARTVMETGIRCAMARGLGDRTSRLASNYEQIDERSTYSDDRGLLREDLAITEEWLERWSVEGEGRLRPWIHNLGVPSCSDDRFLATQELARKHDSGVMCHINRDREEIELAFSLFGERPIEHLHSIGALDDRFLAIHAMLTTDREIKMLAEAGTAVAHAPIVCTDIVSAVTKVVSMRAAGVTVGLGCDTVINDLFKVMRIAFVMHGQASGIPLYDPVALTTEDAMTMATIDAARALRWDHEVGSLEEGKAADVVVVDAENTRLTPAYQPIGTLVRYAVGTDVESVVVAGRVVVDDGRVLTIDEAPLLDEAVRLGDKLGAVLGPRRYRPLAAEATVVP
ncbi:MAG TPA: amidohydrolase family protein [Thermoleophilaceae bacterium]|jgi:5-methylthioadenosine/S-adenosylhomocysteine deaminase|nr:amidohydrolase family protein [Thermoleophilaceae bacterium]